MALTIEQVQAVGIPLNISKLNNRSLLGVAIPNGSVNLYEAIEVVHDYLVGIGSGTETDLSATQSTTTTTIFSSTGDDVIILGANGTRSGVMTASQADNLSNLITLTGVAADSAHLGTFTGSTIADSSTVKTALQALETAVEAVSGESSQDAVGGILTNTATINLTYNDSTPSITADVNNGSITYSKIQNISTNNRLLGRSTAGAGSAEEITVGSGLSLSAGTLTATGGSGTVTSVAITTPGFISVSGSPITTSGTLALSLATQAANAVFAGPTSGTSAPTFRALVAGDIPTLTSSKISDFDESVDDRVAALLVEGSGITLTYDDGSNTLTIEAPAAGYTDEDAQDAIGGILLDSTTIDLSYNDTTPTITAGVKSNSISNNLLQSGVGGIYKGSGTIASGVAATVTNTSTFRINFDSSNPGLLVDDLNGASWLGSDNGSNFVFVDDNEVLLEASEVNITGITSFNDPIVLVSMNTTARDALTPAVGWVIFNTTTTKMECYDGSTWQQAW